MLTAAAKVFFWSFVVGLLLLVFSLGMLWAVRGLAYEVHSSLFALSEHELDFARYWMMGLMKIGVFLLFFVPWVGVLLARRQLRSRAGGSRTG